MILNTEELVEKFLETQPYFPEDVVGTLFDRVYTYKEVLCAWIDADNSRDKAAKILGMKDGKQLDNFLQRKTFQKNIGKTTRRAYKVFMANSIGLSYCDECEEYLPVKEFTFILRGAKTNSKDPEYRNLCFTHYNIYQQGHNKVWRKNNPEKIRAYSAKRRALINETYAVSIEEQRLIWKFYEECPAGYDIDHILPIARGGTQTLDNLQYMKHESNLRKHTKTNEEWIKFCNLKEIETGILEKNSS